MSVITTHAVDALIGGLEREVGPGAGVLEAGCGRFKHFAYPDTMRIAGLDISADQLERNTYAHEKFQGDVQTFSLKHKSHSAIVTSWILTAKGLSMVTSRRGFSMLRASSEVSSDPCQ